MKTHRLLLLAALSLLATLRLASAQCDIVKLKAADASGQDWFGASVSSYGDRILVGAPHDDPSDPSSGSAYVFERQGAGWVQGAKLVASEGDVADEFGYSVALHDDLALVGAVSGGGITPNSGSVYVFEWTGSAWVEIAELFAADGGGSFGYSVSLFGDTALVGKPTDSDAAFQAGAVYVFEREGQDWVPVAKLLASDAGASDSFGSSISLFEDVALVGALTHDAGGVQDTGAAYIFERGISGGWGQFETDKLVASDAGVNHHLGASVSVHGYTALVGASGPPMGPGSTYLFERTAPGVWGPNETIKLTASDGAPNDFFGGHVALYEGNALVCAVGDDDMGVDSGSAYVFLKESCANWTPNETAKLLPEDGHEGDYFGRAVSLSGLVATIGAHLDDEPYNSGSVYVLSPAVGTPYCFGTGGVTCPCGNSAGPDEGCANSSGVGAHLCASGSIRVCADDVTFHCSGLLPGQPALLFAGQAAVNGGVGIVFGDGLRCAGTNVVRLGVRSPDAMGNATWGPGLNAGGAWSAGDTRYFQGWYRDPNGGPCGSGFNLSNGVEVAFAQ